MLLTEQWLLLFLNFALTWILSLSIFSDLAAYCLTVEIRLINVTGNWKNRNMLFNQDVLDENVCNEMWFFMSLYCSVSTVNLFGGKEMQDVGIWFPTSCLFVWCIIYLNGKIVNLRHVAYFFSIFNMFFTVFVSATIYWIMLWRDAFLLSTWVEVWVFLKSRKTPLHWIFVWRIRLSLLTIKSHR